ncbi:Uncharacterized protein RNJ44_04440 [Nakaseomyces bracarensis]|uniref:Nucleoporin n=1 Tax=Nakaseomyces bracarensis TaxID=273131 RepID=A0ABR4NUX1_9SACH
MEGNRWNMFSDTPRGNHWLNTPIESINKTQPPKATSIRAAETDANSRFFSRSFGGNTSAETVTEDLKLPGPKQPHQRRQHNNLPLISTEVLDVSRQRLLVLIAFLLIQAYKLYDTILLHSGIPVSGLFLGTGSFNFISKYLIIDSLFFYILPSFQIPRLIFPFWVIVLQIAIMTGFNFILCNNKGMLLITFVVSIWKKMNMKEFTLSGEAIKNKEIPNYSSHFKGALTIKILPENTALFNPFQTPYCFPLDNPQGNKNLVNVPIRINSTSSIEYIQLNYKDLYTNEVSILNFTSKTFKSLDSSYDLENDEANKNVKYISLPLDKIGLYEIKNIKDSNGFNLRIQPSHLVVPHCPTIGIVGSGKENRCIGDSDVLKMELHGVPPMKLTYSKTIDTTKYDYVDGNIQPEYFESPLLSAQKAVFNSEDLEDLNWARPHPIEINFDTIIQESGDYVYKVEKLVDGLGNEMDFSGLSDELIEKYNIGYGFTVHGIPSAYLSEQFNPSSEMKKTIFINLQTDGKKSSDYNVEIEFIDENGVSQKSHITSPPNTNKAEISVNKPGLYKVLYINSGFCPGVVSGKSSILVTKPVAPELKVVSNPILDSCVGQVGLDFDLTFTGVPPFKVPLKVYKLDGERKSVYRKEIISSDSARKHFNFSPKEEGSYEIVFESITNRLFSDPISLSPKKEYSFKTSMRVKPSVQLVKNTKIDLCLGQNNYVGVEFKGEPPFTVDYDILETSSNKRKSFHEEDITNSRYDIQLPVFDIGGEYILSLVSIKDATGCLVSVTEPDAMINVRRDTPTATFAGNGKDTDILIKEGTTAKLPLKLNGIPPFTVKYQLIAESGEIEEEFSQVFHGNDKRAISVSKAGKYQLTGIKDQTCEGLIEEKGNTFTVQYLPKPSFYIQNNRKIDNITETTFRKSDICQYEEGIVDLSFIGSPPFTLKYDLKSPSGELTSDVIQVATKYVSLKFPSQEAGEYTMIVKGLADSNYNEIDLNNIGHRASLMTIKQHIHAAPLVEFADSGRTLKTCISDIGDQNLFEPIKLKSINGKAPFSITINVYHESTSRIDQFVIDEVNGTLLPSKEIYSDLKMGNHEIRIVKIVDSNGCVNEDASLSDNHVFISVMDAPKIHLLDPSSHYCVGDYVSYQLNGVPPYHIGYEFNGVLLKTTEKTSQFVRYASEPGVISIRSLQDSASKFVVDFMKSGFKNEYESLSLNIHPIPSVTVSQGKYTVADIHEGDQVEVVFAFQGVPPFSLTYIRAEDSAIKGKQQVIETHKVSDIYEYEYRLVTSLQGTYEAIEISDAYCFAKNDAFFNA